ncbi:MAG: HD domain-containing protein [Lachnospiraceae bacterium]|jgi:uncharacterized protein|nr:HD domain-containing protein [Lachnospiraceae bacterium]
MEKINRILEHDLFNVYLSEISRIEEKEREFCHHDLIHFLDVARIAMILNLEEGIYVDKVLVYAAALLHDIGKHMEYKQQIPHEQASAILAPRILRDCGFEEPEVRLIVQAVAGHRSVHLAEAPTLSGIIYRADKLSRPCFSCAAADQCNWSDEKKNHALKY